MMLCRASFTKHDLACEKVHFCMSSYPDVPQPSASKHRTSAKNHRKQPHWVDSTTQKPHFTESHRTTGG